MLKAFLEWFQKNTVLLEQSSISVEVSKASEGSSNDSIHANLETERYGATVQLWQDGQSDFGFIEWEIADSPSDMQVTHYDFQNEGELFVKLDALVKRMSSDLLRLVRSYPGVSGHSETTYIDSPLGQSSSTSAIKREIQINFSPGKREEQDLRAGWMQDRADVLDPEFFAKGGHEVRH